MSLSHNLLFCNPNICTTQSRRPYILQTMTFDGLNYLIFKNRKLTPSGYKGIGIRKFEFVTKQISIYLHIYFPWVSVMVSVRLYPMNVKNG